MQHIIFNRPTSEFKVFYNGVLRYKYSANGSAWGDANKYGHDAQIAPGHYKLTHVERIDPPIASEGAGQIYVADLTPADVSSLAQSGVTRFDPATRRTITIPKAKWQGDNVVIGGIALPIGGLAKWGRAEIMIHAGGSACPDPFAPMQPLAKTYGCTRTHNADLAQLMTFLEPIIASGEHVIYSVIGDSPELPQ